MGSSISSLLLLLLLQAGAPIGPQKVSGRILRPGAETLQPVPGVWATLHRVGSDHASPLDSTRAGADGRYSFSYRRSGDPDAIYFVSASFGGIAYFTSPFKAANVTGEDAEIVVYDTTSRAVPISVRGRHVVVSSAEANGLRTVTEVFELVNDSTVTAIAGDARRKTPVWSASTPAQGRDFKVLQGDIPAAAVSFENGRVNVFAPMPPGLKQLVVGYSLPSSAFPVSIPSQVETEVYEVLIEDPSGRVSGAKLAEVDPIALERRSFRRFLGSQVPANAVVVIDLPPASRPIRSSYMVALTAGFGLLMVGALARALRRR